MDQQTNKQEPSGKKVKRQLVETHEQRAIDAKEICKAYVEAQEAIAKIGTLLRTTYAGRFLWSNRHRTAISGIKATLCIMRSDVPDYRPGVPDYRPGRD
jgi:hypothetical protein